MFKDNNFVFYHVSRDEVENKKIKGFRKIVKSLDEELGGGFGKLIVTFSGYDEDAREIWEIPEIRKFVTRMFKECPHLLFLTNFEMNAHEILLPCYADIEFMYHGERRSINDWLRAGINPNTLPEMDIIVFISNEKLEYLIKKVKEYGGKHKRIAETLMVVNYLESKFKDKVK